MTGCPNQKARSLPQASSADPAYKPRRLNKAIELWEDNQVAFYNVYWPSGAPDGYDMRMLPGDNEEAVHKSREYSRRKMPA